MLIFLYAVLLTVVDLLCICYYLVSIFVTLCIVLPCVYCCLTYFSCRITG